ncbi:hypothetical protein ER45_028725 (plasmid) [Bacillus mycoides]|nr:hypothetical protein ER45_028725 [Bacillus mycoides]
MMKASDLIIRCLEAEGVEYIFGIPGEENIDVMDSLTRSSIQFILARRSLYGGHLWQNHWKTRGMFINSWTWRNQFDYWCR